LTEKFTVSGEKVNPMDKREETRTKVDWTVQSIREYVLARHDPRDAGGMDAHAGRQPPQGNYLPAFLRDCHTRAEAMCRVIEENAQDEFIELAAALRSSPFALDTAIQQIHSVPQTVAAQIDGHIEHSATEIGDRRTDVDRAGIVYRRDLQVADATHPRGGWREPLEFWPPVAGIVLIEGGIAAAMLWHALGSMKALVTGIALALIAVGGGMLSALTLLHPTRRELDTQVARAGQWLLALLVAAITLLLMYVGACYRAAWIEGLDGKPADLISKFQSPAEVLTNFDVLALAALGFVGFFIGARECFRYFHGYRPLLRESGLAKAHADEAIRDLTNALKTFVNNAGGGSEVQLEEIEQKNGAWIRAVAEYADSATGVALEDNRRFDLVRRIFDGIVAEYRDGYYEVRPFDRTVTLSYVVNGTDIEVPVVFSSTRQSAIEAAANVSAAGRQARLEIARIISESIGRIDDLAGLRRKPTVPSLLPDRGGWP
jgi:hypothetical protein